MARKRGADPGLFKRIDLNLLKVFREIARARGIGAAARRLGLQQPAVSLALKRLEAHLDTELCLRGAKGIELTPAGRVVAQMSESLFAEVQALPDTVAAATGRIEGVVTIRMVSGVVSPEFDAALETMRRRYPKIRLRLDVAPARIVIDALVKGQADICIAFDAASRADLQYEPLLREHQQLYCGRGHVLYGKTIKAPEKLKAEPFVLTGLDEPDEVRRYRYRHRLGLEPVGEAENLEEAKRLIGAGVGIGFLPTVLIDKSTASSNFWPLLPRKALPNYLLYLIAKPAVQQTAATRLFLEEIAPRLRAPRHA